MELVIDDHGGDHDDSDVLLDDSASEDSVDEEPPSNDNEDQSTGDDSDSSGSDEVDVHALPDYLRDIAIQHATWFIEQKYGSKGTEAQVSRSMTICRLLLEKANADRDIVDSIPADFQQALRRIKHLVLDMDQIDACVKDHHLFRDDSVTVCPYPGFGEARYDRNGNARRAAFYVKPEDWLSELLTTVKICQQFDYMRAYIEEKKFRGEADDELRDFFSGSIFKDVIDPYIRAHGVDVFKTVVCGMCFDEVAISRWPTKNICPVLLSIYNCPPWIRNLMTMLLMVAILPTNCKNVQMYLEPAVEMFAALKPGGDGFPVISPLTGQVETWYAMIALTINDMRGISKGNCQMQAPSKVNACNCCAVRGFHLSCYKTTMYPSAVTFLPSGHRLRREYRRTFSKCPTLRKMADVTQPRFFTDEYVRAAMDLAEQSDLKTTSDNHPAKKYGFYQRSCFVKLLDYWRPWMMNIRDTDHMLMNRVRMIINALKGTGNMTVSAKKRDFEISLGRFEDYKPIVNTKPDGSTSTTYPWLPWRASSGEIDFIDNVLPGLVRLPQSMFSGKLPRFFSDTLTIGCFFPELDWR